MYDEHYDDRDSCLATPDQSVAEWARNVGWYPRFRYQAWLGHDWDVWVANPHYVGFPCPHPEDDDAERPEELTEVEKLYLTHELA